MDTPAPPAPPSPPQVAAAGAKVFDKPEASEFGAFGWFLDPDGNKVELWQPPGDATPDEAAT